MYIERDNRMNYKELLVTYGKKLIHEGFTVETWGNISVRGDDGLIYITPSGMDYETCTEDDICVLNLETGEMTEGNRRPSIEKDLHLEVYRHRPEVGAVVHTHPIYSTIFACMGKTIPMVCDESAQTLGDEVRCAGYALPGSQELADNCIKALGEKANACMLMSHGSVCLGKNLKGAFKTARVLEMTAEIYYRILSIGGQYIPISDENIHIMQDVLPKAYGQKA